MKTTTVTLTEVAADPVLSLAPADYLGPSRAEVLNEIAEINGMRRAEV